LFVINKSDRPGADRITREIQLVLHLRLGKALRNVPAHHGVDLKRVGKQAKPAVEESKDWDPPVLQTVAENGAGVPELAVTLDRHREWLRDSGELSRRRRERLAERVREAVERRVQQIVWREAGGQRILDDALADLEAGSDTPYSVAERIAQVVKG
jgi:LAO/AO transport system kinase